MIFTADPVTDELTSAAHGLADGARVELSSAGALPGPLDARNVYYVRDATADAFRLGYYQGDSAIDILDAGTGVHTATKARRRSALHAMYLDVVGYFASRGEGEVIRWGRRELTFQVNQHSTRRAGRVVFVPGDDAGKMGALGATRAPGRLPRAIHSFDELASVHVWGCDLSSARDEATQYAAAWDLFELAVCAIRASSAGRYELSDPECVPAPVEAVFGFAITFNVTVHGSIVEPAKAIGRATTAQVDPSLMSFPDGDVAVPPSP